MSTVNINSYSNSLNVWLHELRQEIHYYDFFDNDNFENMKSASDQVDENPYVNIWECANDNFSENSDNLEGITTKGNEEGNKTNETKLVLTGLVDAKPIQENQLIESPITIDKSRFKKLDKSNECKAKDSNEINIEENDLGFPEANISMKKTVFDDSAESLDHLSENSNYLSDCSSEFSLNLSNRELSNQNNLIIKENHISVGNFTKSAPKIVLKDSLNNTNQQVNKSKIKIKNCTRSVLNMNVMEYILDKDDPHEYFKHNVIFYDSFKNDIQAKLRRSMVSSSSDIYFEKNKEFDAKCVTFDSLPNLSQNCDKNKTLATKEDSIEFISIDTIDNVSNYTDKNQNSNYLESIESLIDNLFDFEEEHLKEQDFLSIKSDFESLENLENCKYVSKENVDKELLKSFNENSEWFIKLRTKYYSEKPVYEEKLLKTLSLPNINQRFSFRTTELNENPQVLLEVPNFTIKSSTDDLNDYSYKDTKENTADLNNFKGLDYTKEENILSEVSNEKGSILRLPGFEIKSDNANAHSKDSLVEYLRENVVFWMKEVLRYATEEEEDFVVMEQTELLKNLHQYPSKREKTQHLSRFPLDDDNSVEIRRNRPVGYNRVSKTVDFTTHPLKCPQVNARSFEIRGLVKFQLPDQCIITKLNTEYISYENGSFYKAGKNRISKDLLRSNVILKSIRYLNKNKEVQLTDSRNDTYVIFFDSPKYAKQFMDNDVIQELVEDNSTNSSTTLLKKRLLKYLGRRSTREDLEKIGIYKNEPIFGNTLRAIFQKGGADFIRKVISLIEKPEHMKSLGLYRTSGNLAMIQKIRLQVDNGKLDILDQYSRDPDVLTGSLKLFFRELKEPLISIEVCDQLLGFTGKDPKNFTSEDLSKINKVLTKNLHESNRETLFVLIRHLLEVIKHKSDNKMDAYNLSVCWGPSLVFQVVTSPTNPPNALEKSFDLVTQSQEAMKLVEFLLSFYTAHPDQLALLKDEMEQMDRLNPLKTTDFSSKESLDSHGSYGRRSNRSTSSQSLNIDETVKKAIDFVEANIPSEGLYTRTISSDKANKILKKLIKRKDADTEKSKMEAVDVGEALKKYLKDSQDWLVTKDVFEAVFRASKDYHGLYLDPNTRNKVTTSIEDLPKKDTFIFFIRHLAKVVEDKNLPRLKKEELYQIWSRILNHQNRLSPSEENVVKFLQICVKVFDQNVNNNLPDLVPHAEFLEDLKSVQRERTQSLSKKRTYKLSSLSETDRHSRYDNLDDSDTGEAQFLDEGVHVKTENTKL